MLCAFALSIIQWLLQEHVYKLQIFIRLMQIAINMIIKPKTQHNKIIAVLILPLPEFGGKTTRRQDNGSGQRQ